MTGRQIDIKREPEPEKPKWSLIAVSEAARKWCSLIQLEPNKVYTVGRKRNNDIRIPTGLCSKSHCVLEVSDNEVIMKDQSLYGTRVNSINYKDSRCIVSENDLIGFGCSPYAKRIKDKSDKRYYVYRLALGNKIGSGETIELSDGSDDEGQHANKSYDAFDALDVGNDTDDDNSSDEEEDIKPDIHTLMRTAMATMQIKQEVEGYCYDYDRNRLNSDEQVIHNEVPICLDSDEEKEDILLLEPPRKRIRTEQEYAFPTPEPEPEPEPEPMKEEEDTNSDQTLPEYQMSDTALKEKVKLVTCSRGQQLATDMLKTQKVLLKNIAQKPLHQEAGSSSSWNQTYKPPSEYSNFSIADLSNAFISEITKWDYQWIKDRKPNPLRYQMDVKHLDTNFSDLDSFQRQMKNLLLMEIYSIILAECSTSIPHTFTRVDDLRFDENRKRYIYKCSTEKKDCRVSEIKPGLCTAFAHSYGKCLGYVSQAKRFSDKWEFEMQTDFVDRKKFIPKCIQVEFVTNIQPMLECFVSLYELRKSSLQYVFLRPSSQYEEVNSSIDDDFVADDSANLNEIYKRCAVSALGNSKILLVNGGAGSGKTKFICNLLERFNSEDFQYTDSILVCGRGNALVDDMAARILPKISNIARFGQISIMRKDIRRIGVETFDPKLKKVKIVFTTLNNAFDLLHIDRSFDVCIVDDASLCTEVELLPLFRLKLTTLLLVGDEKLQASTTQNECCHENGYSRSLFSRVIASYKIFDSKRILYPTLYKQRRMLPEICSWPNKYFYDSKMEIVPIVRPPKRSPFHSYTIFQVNTIEDIEVDFVRQLLEFSIRDIKGRRCSLGIICGHPDSRVEIETMIKANDQFAGVEVSGYESFQGQEKDVILMVVLKPKDGFKLFSTNENLLIALTRAKESLIFCGNFQYVCTDLSSDICTETDAMTNTWKALINDAKIRKRFIDLNGTFDQQLVSNSLK
ncbi:uncharacterized protein LOC129574522 isoform X2 [Sitodiplosis mosellana]|uniref:uncharacterized protein LOC129574522 isoform X2 n=1 Tax=Sitodiplosis mosellana TaxID=263140 RepID=UPI0024437A8B|nr:uncharacterized protein LOC129574522 isoform X2 [Sitodiplosis mosellana]